MAITYGELNWRWAALLGLCVLAPHCALANGLELFGAGARSQAMAGAVAAVSDDYTSLYHNPAGIVLGKPTFGLSIQGAYDRSTILMSRRPRGYEPDRYGAAPEDNDEGAKFGHVGIGISAKPFGPNFAFGAYIQAPFDGFARVGTRYNDEREQYQTNGLDFPLLRDRMGGETITVGMAYGLRPWVSVGLGVLVLPQVRTETRIYQTSTELDNYNLSIKNGTTEALVAGVHFKPASWLAIGLVFQDELFMRIEGANYVNVEGGTLPDQALDVTQNGLPLRMSGSAAFKVAERHTLAFEATWYNWSRYRGDHSEALNLNDVVHYKLGLESSLKGGSYFRLGTALHPSPTELQTGRSNVVDNDRVLISLGAGRDFAVSKRKFRLDFALQGHALRDRVVQKAQPNGAGEACAPGVTSLCDEDEELAGLQTGNPGFPGYTHGGYVITTSVELKWFF